MNYLLELLHQPLPWFVSGPLLGLTVPILLIIGNKSLGISSSLRHICASCLPAKIPFFQYDWRKEIWNLFFVFGILLGGVFTSFFLFNNDPIKVNPDMAVIWSQYGIVDFTGIVPKDLFNCNSLFSARGFTLMGIGGFLIGFGSRYAGGCTSGHAIMGLSTLQLPSLIASFCFMLGGFIGTHFLLPFILSL